MNSTKPGIVILGLLLAMAMNATAQQTTTGADKLKAEIEAVYGFFPQFMKLYPESARAGVFEWVKGMESPDGVIPRKYMELISLAVASQIPCDYCVYAHTASAKISGANEEEIRSAVALAAYIRHWSTILNGGGIDMEEFKAEWDKILAHLEAQSESSGAEKSE